MRKLIVLALLLPGYSYVWAAEGRQIDRTNEDENFRRSGTVTFPRQAGLEFRWRFGS